MNDLQDRDSAASQVMSVLHLLGLKHSAAHFAKVYGDGSAERIKQALKDLHMLIDTQLFRLPELEKSAAERR